MCVCVWSNAVQGRLVRLLHCTLGCCVVVGAWGFGCVVARLCQRAVQDHIIQRLAAKISVKENPRQAQRVALD